MYKLGPKQLENRYYSSLYLCLDFIFLLLVFLLISRLTFINFHNLELYIVIFAMTPFALAIPSLTNRIASEWLVFGAESLQIVSDQKKTQKQLRSIPKKFIKEFLYFNNGSGVLKYKLFEDEKRIHRILFSARPASEFEDLRNDLDQIQGVRQHKISVLKMFLILSSLVVAPTVVTMSIFFGIDHLIHSSDSLFSWRPSTLDIAFVKIIFLVALVVTAQLSIHVFGISPLTFYLFKKPMK